jgi:hypothetical protein
MTKKDYTRIARAIAKTRAYYAKYYGEESSILEIVEDVAIEIGKELSADNPRFYPAQFMKACGFEWYQ